MRCVRLAVFAGSILAFSGSARAADQVVFIVRHAERAAASQPSPNRMMADDPPLSPAGRERAAKLAAMLASADVEHIFTTEYVRTRQTAAPLAEKQRLQVVMTAAKDPSPLVEQVRTLSGNVLVVGHSNTVPDLLKRLGVKESVTIGENEYDQLFVLVRHGAAAPTLITLRY